MLIRGKRWWWEYFKALFFSIFSHMRGSVTLGHGYTEMEIKIDSLLEAKRIFVAVEADDIPICAGNVNTVGAIKTRSNTFILYADIKSNTATVYWLVDYTLKDTDQSIDNIT